MGKASGPGASGGSVIMVKEELTGSGKTVNIPLIGRANGPGVRGNTALVGAETAMDNYNCAMAVKTVRNAHLLTEQEEHWTEMDLREAVRFNMRQWSSEWLRDDFILSLADPFGYSFAGGQVATSENDADTIYTPTTFFAAMHADQTAMDAWVLANRDRILYGPDLAHLEADSDHSDSVVKLTASTDKASAVVLRLAKGLAKTSTGPKIRPTKTEMSMGREYFVWFVGSADFGNLKADADIKAANIDARARDVSSNPIFQDGDLIYDGVIIREIPEIVTWNATAGATNSPVTISFFAGAQALGLAWGKRPTSRKRGEDDYGHLTGLGISEIRGVKKMVYNGKQHGLVTVFCAAA
jgi:hypothetical protein